MQVLAIDIGGTNVKLLRTGDSERRKFPSGPNLTPKRFAKGIKVATQGWSYDAVTVGLPAPIADGRPLIDPVNLGSGWTDFDFGALFPDVPCILANDAELQALGSWPGEGKMLYLGLGTGLGNAMVLPDQAGLPVVVPMELGHLPYRDGKTFEQCVGIAALKENGKKEWERDVFETIEKSGREADAMTPSVRFRRAHHPPWILRDHEWVHGPTPRDGHDRVDLDTSTACSLVIRLESAG